MGGVGAFENCWIGLRLALGTRSEDARRSWEFLSFLELEQMKRNFNNQTGKWTPF